MYHLAKVIEVILPEEEGTKSADNNGHALVETWDENKIIFRVSPKISASLKPGDFVLIDFSPVPCGGSAVPRHEITVIVKKSKGEKLWKSLVEYFHEKRRKRSSYGEVPAVQFPDHGM